MLRGSFGKGFGRVALASAAILGTILGTILGAANVSATPLTPFRYEAQAQRHCPGDKVVWLDFRKASTTARDRSSMAKASTAASSA